jgi:peptide/nickel transport system substrate-binding protein
MKKHKYALSVLAALLLSQNVVAGGTLRIDEAPIGELDPAKALDSADSILMFNVYDSLFVPTPGKPDFEPFLVKSWETDGLHYTFHLKKDVHFQSGHVLTAADVVFSFNRMMAIGQGQSYLFSKVDHVKAIDPHTVVFTLKEKYAPFIASLVLLAIIDKKQVMAHLGDGDGKMKDWGQAYLSEHAAGSGAYTVVSHHPQSETVLAKNDHYFLPISAKAPDEVRVRYGLEAATVRTLMIQGKHDISSQWLPPEVLRSLANKGMQLLTERGTTEFFIKMNTAKAPFDDIECRRAMVSAFDYASGIKMVAINRDVAQGSPATGALPVGMLGALPAENAFKQDIKAAKAHLAQSKYKPGEMNVEISWIGEVPIEERFALLMQANLAQIGVKSTVRKVPWSLFTELVSKPETTPNISQVFVPSTNGDPDTILYGSYYSKNAGTWLSPEYLKDKEVDQLLDQGRTAPAEQRAAVYTKLNKRLISLAPAIFAQDQIAVMAASNRVRVPAFSDPAKAYNVSSFGYTFRLMEMKD